MELSGPKVKEKPTLRLQILLAVTLLVAVVAIVSGIFTAYLSNKSATDCLEMTMTEAANIATGKVTSEVNRISVLTTEISSNIILSGEEYTPEQKIAFLNEKADTYGLVGAYYYTADGTALNDDKNYSSSEFFQTASKGQTYFSEPITDEATGEFVIITATAVKDDSSKLVGVVEFLVRQQTINDIVENIKVSDDGTAFIINKDGTNIANCDVQKAVIYENAIELAKTDSSLTTLAAIISEAKDGTNGFGEYTYNGVKKFVAFAPIGGTDGWSMCISAPQKDFTHTARSAIYIVCIIVALSILTGLVIATIMTKSLEVALGGVIKRLAAFAEGDIVTEMPDVAANSYESVVLKRTTKLMIENTSAIIKDIDYLLTEMSQGNLDIYSSYADRYVGDYLDIFTAMKNLKLGLTESFENIMQVSDQVSAGSNQVSSGAQTLAQGATEQASSIQELSASITEVSQRVIQNAADAKNAKDISSQAEEIMQGSVIDMEHAHQAMEEISTTSKDISKVIKAIDDIAFQTNILALNAAVEAARAGAAGKGFAVVADEVRNLSQKSAEAAKNTTALIESSILAVEKGTGLVNKTSAGFAQVAAKSAEVGKIVDTISIQAQEQANAVSQISIGIDQVSSVVQMNSATSEESAAASEELSSQAAVLKGLVGSFKLATSFAEE